MELGSFSVITEFGVALAGFSGIVVAIGHQGRMINPLDWYRTVTMMMRALTAAFGGLAPMGLASAGLAGEELVRWASVIILAILVGSGLDNLRRVLSLAPQDRVQLARPMWVLTLGGMIVFASLLLWNSVYFLSWAPIVAALVWELVMAAILFVLIVRAQHGT